MRRLRVKGGIRLSMMKIERMIVCLLKYKSTQIFQGVFKQLRLFTIIVYSIRWGKGEDSTQSISFYSVELLAQQGQVLVVLRAWSSTTMTDLWFNKVQLVVWGLQYQSYCKYVYSS